MSPLFVRAILAAGLAAAGAVAQAQPAPERASTRGELLYATHCIECHNTQMHWRELKQAYDWDSLKAQVRRWQDIAMLGWDEDDIDEVARYLNQSIYRFPHPEDRAVSQPRDGAPLR